jgi:hypothetical protein
MAKTRGLLLRGGDVLTPNGFRPGVDVRIDDGVITHVDPDLSTSGAEVLDARNLIVAPGFIDVHVHGAGGAMCEQGDAGGIDTISTTLARYGTTGFLATIATLPPDALREAVRAVAGAAGHEPGARILGIHLEGPYLNPRRAGAQAIASMRAPSIEEFDALQDLSGGLIRLVTIAPELDGAIPFIRAVRERDVVVAAGHSNATEAEMKLAVQAGVTHVTHLFNAMRELHHRERRRGAHRRPLVDRADLRRAPSQPKHGRPRAPVQAAAEGGAGHRRGRGVGPARWRVRDVRGLLRGGGGSCTAAGRGPTGRELLEPRLRRSQRAAVAAGFAVGGPARCCLASTRSRGRHELGHDRAWQGCRSGLAQPRALGEPDHPGRGGGVVACAVTCTCPRARIVSKFPLDEVPGLP